MGRDAAGCGVARAARAGCPKVSHSQHVCPPSAEYLIGRVEGATPPFKAAPAAGAQPEGAEPGPAAPPPAPAETEEKEEADAPALRKGQVLKVGAGRRADGHRSSRCRSRASRTGARRQPADTCSRRAAPRAQAGRPPACRSRRGSQTGARQTVCSSLAARLVHTRRRAWRRGRRSRTTRAASASPWPARWAQLPRLGGPPRRSRPPRCPGLVRTRLQLPAARHPPAPCQPAALRCPAAGCRTSAWACLWGTTSP